MSWRIGKLSPHLSHRSHLYFLRASKPIAIDSAEFFMPTMGSSD
jgi:hypothetical protein